VDGYFEIDRARQAMVDIFLVPVGAR